MVKELSELSMTAYSKEHGIYWRWAVLANILSLCKIISIINVDRKRLNVIVELTNDQEKLPKESTQVLLQSMSNLIWKICLVQVIIIPYNPDEITEKEQYLITINYT